MAVYDMGTQRNPRRYDTASIGAAMAGGAAASRPNQKSPGMNPNFLGGQAQQFQGALAGQVQGFSQYAAQQLQREIGNMLGNLNSIGALRSGAVSTGLADASQRFGDAVGYHASQTAMGGLQMAQEEHDRNTERAYREAERRRAAQRGRMGLIGRALGGGLTGLITGGPLGAVTGAIGGAMGR